MIFFIQPVIILMVLTKIIFVNTTPHKQVNSAYTTAFEYIRLHNIDTPIIVIDTTVHLSLSSFSTALIKEWNLNRPTVHKMLDSIDHVNTGYGTKIEGIKNLKNKGGKNIRILYFSNVIDSILIAEIMPRREIYVIKQFRKEAKKQNYNSLDHSNQAYYNNSVKYLFIFDHDMHLKKVFSQEMIYN